MGYRSTVAISIYGDQEEMYKLDQYFQIEFALLAPGERENVLYLIEQANSNGVADVWGSKDNLDFNFYVEDVKWYEGYPEVDLFMRLMDKARTFDNLVVEYVCIGEELDDITQNRFYNNPELNEWRLQVNRTVEWA